MNMKEVLGFIIGMAVGMGTVIYGFVMNTRALRPVYQQLVNSGCREIKYIEDGVEMNKGICVLPDGRMYTTKAR
jgi:hypothetical protein